MRERVRGPERKYTSQDIDVTGTPLLPFGRGPSPTTFEYRDVELSADSASNGEPVEVAWVAARKRSWRPVSR